MNAKEYKQDVTKLNKTLGIEKTTKSQIKLKHKITKTEKQASAS